MKNLTSLLSYVLGLDKSMLIHSRLFKIELYARFLNQKLTDKYEVNGVMAYPLNRFVPCDLDGNRLDKPRAGMSGYDHLYKNYEAAKNRCLFVFDLKEPKSDFLVNRDFSISISFFENKFSINGSELNIIEDLIEYNFELTETAQRQIGVSKN